MLTFRLRRIGWTVNLPYKFETGGRPELEPQIPGVVNKEPCEGRACALAADGDERVRVATRRMFQRAISPTLLRSRSPFDHMREAGVQFRLPREPRAGPDLTIAHLGL